MIDDRAPLHVPRERLRCPIRLDLRPTDRVHLRRRGLLGPGGQAPLDLGECPDAVLELRSGLAVVDDETGREMRDRDRRVRRVAMLASTSGPACGVDPEISVE